MNFDNVCVHALMILVTSYCVSHLYSYTVCHILILWFYPVSHFQLCISSIIIINVLELSKLYYFAFGPELYEHSIEFDPRFMMTSFNECSPKSMNYCL